MGKNEDLDPFLFEFDILCRIYNYLQDAHKLKLFPATLKDSILIWFMGLGESSIRTWEDMKTKFLQKYQEYCKPRDSRNDIFKIQQLEDEILETISKYLSIHYININITNFKKMQYEHSSLKGS